ncbi:MAG TPA: DUF4282 domain-containing protein [Acidimicrobiales bacterium]|nr:DUF4282 domain-containing protein [Acidimicrobiales bacterium]
MTQSQTTNLQTKGFLGSLFDFSFKSLIGSRVIRVLYVLWMALLALGAIVLIIGAFEVNPAFGAVALLILGPVYFLFNLIVARVLLELVMAIFAIQENTNRISSIGWPLPLQPRSEVGHSPFNDMAGKGSVGQQDVAPAN